MTVTLELFCTVFNVDPYVSISGPIKCKVLAGRQQVKWYSFQVVSLQQKLKITDTVIMIVKLHYSHPFLKEHQIHKKMQGFT